MNAVWPHELRRGGRVVLALPLVAAAAVCAFPAGVLPGILVAYVVPLVSGLCATSVVADERMVELQLTVPTPYPRTVARRLALLLLTSLVAGLVLVAVLSRVRPAKALAGMLVLTVALVAVAAFVAAGTRSAPGASACVFAAWLAKILVLDQALRSVAAQAVLLAVVTVVLLRLAWERLADSENQLREEAR